MWLGSFPLFFESISVRRIDNCIYVILCLPFNRLATQMSERAPLLTLSWGIRKFLFPPPLVTQSTSRYSDFLPRNSSDYSINKRNFILFWLPSLDRPCMWSQACAYVTALVSSCRLSFPLKLRWSALGFCLSTRWETTCPLFLTYPSKSTCKIEWQCCVLLEC